MGVFPDATGVSSMFKSARLQMRDQNQVLLSYRCSSLTVLQSVASNRPIPTGKLCQIVWSFSTSAIHVLAEHCIFFRIQGSLKALNAHATDGRIADDP